MSRKLFWLKLIVLPALLVLSLGSIQAQITGFIPVFVDEIGTEEASVIFQDFGTGNIGIGTTNPTSKLEIAAQNGLKITGPEPFLTLEDTGVVGNPRSIVAGGKGDLGFFPDSFIGGNVAMIIKNGSGNVGIGETNPQAKLVVESADRISILGETRSSDDTSIGVFGRNSAPTGHTFGVWGETNSSSLGTAGVLGVATASTGVTHGVWGQVASLNGVGGTFLNLGGGDSIQGQDSQRRVVFRVTNNGMAVARALQITSGADLSEKFEVAHAQNKIEPGMVVAIDPQNPGKLVVSAQAYNRRVAGILSGAGGVQPGMLMGQAGTLADGSHPVALTGRVYVWADASNGPIAPGDLLTTSNVPGHAMKVTNYGKAQGAILGKAMTGLKEGKGLVLVLVTLQ